MPSGGCFCNNIKVSFTGEPEANVLCHCYDCRKISGATYSTNIIVKQDNFKLESGKPKEISKTAESGKKITSHFCPDCGTTCFRTGEAFPGAVIVKTGILDDPKWVEQNPPKAELFAPQRVAWFKGIEGADQVESMPS